MSIRAMTLWSASGLRRSLTIAAVTLALPLSACGTGTDPEEPASSAATETGDSTEPTVETTAAPDPIGRWSSPEAGEPFLEFSEDGELKGSDGCNAIETRWTLEGDTIVIDSFMTTQKACGGVDTWLSDAASASVEGNVMKVMDSEDRVIGGLEKEQE